MCRLYFRGIYSQKPKNPKTQKPKTQIPKTQKPVSASFSKEKNNTFVAPRRTKTK